MQRPQRALASVLLLALGMGCGSSAKTIPLADLPPKLAEAMCAAVQNCYGPVFGLFLNGADCAATTEQRVLNGTFPMLQSEIDQKKIVYDGAKAQACLDEMSTRSCQQLLERDSPACLAALDGTVPLGGSCILDEECQGKALCKSSTGTCPGQCTALLVAGQACTKDGDCQDGLECSSATKLCVQPAAQGQPCDYGAPPCAPGLLCLGKDDGNQTPGTCETASEALAAGPGAACDPTSGQLCQSGSACVADSLNITSASITWLCVASGSYPPGGACKPGFPEACAAGNYCKTGTGLAALTGTCTTIPAAGEPCGSGLSQCEPSAVCVSGTCQNLVANGVGCTGDAMCYSEYCGTSGGCEARVPCK
jgi:hypothetical protein